jgi:DUF2934 family protein
VPKKQKTPKKPVSTEDHDVAPSPSVAAKSEGGAPAKPRKAGAKTAARKSASPGAAKIKKKASISAVADPTPEQIQLRAYFISEHRHRHGAPGDHHSDWLEARRQLIIESRQN